MQFRKCYALEKIHGTSAHVKFNDTHFSFFSGGANHTNFVNVMLKNMGWDEELILQKYKDKFENKVVTIYGEAYGGKLQGMSDVYGTELKFIAFDVNINGMWVTVPQAENIAKYFGLEFVYYEEISTDIEELNRVRDMHSIQAIRNGLGEGKKGEGVVLRPLMEFTKNDGGRIIVKHKREDFRETKNPRSIEDDLEKLKIWTDSNEVADEWCVPMRLEHILDKIEDKTIGNMKNIIRAMIYDVMIEGKDEISWSPAIEKAISRKTVTLFKERLQRQLREEHDRTRDT